MDLIPSKINMPNVLDKDDIIINYLQFVHKSEVNKKIIVI